MQGLTGWHLVVLLVLVLLLFGASKLPNLARSLGQSMRIFRSEVRTMSDEREADAARKEELRSGSDSAATRVTDPARSTVDPDRDDRTGTR